MLFGADHDCGGCSLSAEWFSTAQKKQAFHTDFSGLIDDFEQPFRGEFIHRCAMAVGCIAERTIEIAAQGGVQLEGHGTLGSVIFPHANAGSDFMRRGHKLNLPPADKGVRNATVGM